MAIVAKPVVFPVAAVSNLVAEIKTAFLCRRDYQRTYDELNALSDHDLADIGICRGQIAALARQHVYGYEG